jgi:[Skp1-protein]-hydroxyproline N-acetylglucosaminyltransferase
MKYKPTYLNNGIRFSPPSLTTTPSSSPSLSSSYFTIKTWKIINFIILWIFVTLLAFTLALTTSLRAIHPDGSNNRPFQDVRRLLKSKPKLIPSSPVIIQPDSNNNNNNQPPNNPNTIPLPAPPTFLLDNNNLQQPLPHQKKSFIIDSTGATLPSTQPLPLDESLLIFMERIRTWLRPFTGRYIKHNPITPLTLNREAVCGPKWSSVRIDSYIKGCPSTSTTDNDNDDSSAGCGNFDTLEEAKSACEVLTPKKCGGVTMFEPNKYEIRASGGELLPSEEHESSWLFFKDPCLVEHKERNSEALLVWEAFHNAVDAALEDSLLHLQRKLGPTKEDDTIFISIAAYRDTTCRATLRRAFERASNPNKISVGIVQQNCMSQTNCYTGTGWAETRKWVKRPGPDPDCAESFCASELGKPHCDAGRVRILRLDEVDSLGPFFTRFVNSKLWRGENFYLQIDAHTDFRQSWDLSMIAQMRATSSYPKSVISNYPPGGTPMSTHPWPAPKHLTKPDSNYPPSALCSCTFETAGQGRYTVRLAEQGRSFNTAMDVPRKSCFVAAGFFIAHGSIVDNVGFDPFLPFLFMGEELALSVRFWTHGYDIYAPSQDVLNHEYVRKESPKFWESVGQVYSYGNMHNELTDLIVQRVQFLSKFPEADTPDKINPKTLLTRMEQFGCGNTRTSDEFAQFMGLDFAKREQIAPKWCSLGG